MPDVHDEVDNLLRLCERFSDTFDSDLLAISSSIYAEATTAVRKMCEGGKHDRAIVILTTPGGDPDEGFRIARALRRRYKHITLLIHGECKSTGTLIALAADELVITNNGELGPLDVQLNRSDEIYGAPQSGLDLHQAFRVLEANAKQTFKAHMLEIRLGAKLSTRLAVQIATELTGAMYRGIYDQIDPIRLGEVQRKIVIANEYGERLATGNVREGTLGTLVNKYPSHGFVIDREEAAKLFHKVREPSAEEEAILRVLPPHLFELQFDRTLVIRLGGNHEDHHDTKAPTPTPATEPVGHAPGGVAGSGCEERGISRVRWWRQRQPPPRRQAIRIRREW
jgi:hypothetical protein